MPDATPVKSTAPRPLKWYHHVLARLISWVVVFMAWSFRFNWTSEDVARVLPRDENVIFCVWHNRLALVLMTYRKMLQRKVTHPMVGLVSASKDGGVLANILRYFNVVPVRGSSSRRGSQAMRELVGLARSRHDIVITPDGPRGPCCQIQPGVISLAQLTDVPILPVGLSTTSSWRLRSWDRFIVPKPFSRCSVKVGALLRVPRKASAEEREALRLTLEETMKQLNEC